MPWTTPITWNNDLLQAFVLNTHIRDNQSFLAYSKFIGVKFPLFGHNTAITYNVPYYYVDSTNMMIQIPSVFTTGRLRACASFNVITLNPPNLCETHFDLTLDDNYFGSLQNGGSLVAGVSTTGLSSVYYGSVASPAGTQIYMQCVFNNVAPNTAHHIGIAAKGISSGGTTPSGLIEGNYSAVSLIVEEF